MNNERSVKRNDFRAPWNDPLAMKQNGAHDTRTGARAVPAGGPRPQHVARSRWSGACLSLSTSYAAADRSGPRSAGGGFMRPTEWNVVKVLYTRQAQT